MESLSTPISFKPYQKYAYIQNAPLLHLRKMPVKITKCLAYLHECRMDSENRIILGRNLDKYIVQGQEGEMNEKARIVTWGKIIVRFIPETERQGKYISFRFEFHFEDGSIQKKQSQFVYSIEKEPFTNEELVKINNTVRLLSQSFAKKHSWKAMVTNPCGIQALDFKFSKRETG